MLKTEGLGLKIEGLLKIEVLAIISRCFSANN